MDSVPAGAEARAAVRAVEEKATSPMSKVLQAGNGNRADPWTGHTGEATKDAAARRPVDKATEECFMTDSCGSCGQVLLWCKCMSDLSLIQRTGRSRQPSASTPMSSVWSSDDDEQYGLADSEIIGRQLVSWTRTSLDPHIGRERAASTSSLEGRELAVM
jgi:hypothetical protein